MNRFAGTWTLTKLALRRDRFMVPAFVLTFVLVVAFSSAASKDLYSTTAELVRVARGWNATTALVAIHGRIYDTSSLGAGSMIKMTGLGTAFIGLLAILLVIRHTRADEETGRTELAAGGVVGSYAALTAALIVSVGTVVVISVLSGLSLALSGFPTAGSIAFAAAWCGAGFVFAGVGAMSAQLATTARAARGLGSAILGATYAVRALGDTSPPHSHRWVAWLSPLGWAQQVRPFAGDRWLALLPPLVAGALLIGGVLAVAARRDIGAGMLADRPGPARAPQLRSAFALARRVQRLALFGWACGVVLMGLLLGSIASTIGDLFDNAKFRTYLQLLGGVKVLEDAFLSTELGFAAIIVSAFGISVGVRMRSEEASGLAEGLLVAGVDRIRFVAAHLLMAFGGVTLLLAIAGLSIGAAHATATGDPAQVLRLVGAALARAPAAWLMTGTAVALFGVSGRLTVLAWVLLVGFIVVGEFGPLMDLPDWTLDVSPFTHVPSLPGGDLTAGPLVWMTVVAAVLVAVGLTAFRRRDLQPD